MKSVVVMQPRAAMTQARPSYCLLSLSHWLRGTRVTCGYRTIFWSSYPSAGWPRSMPVMALASRQAISETSVRGAALTVDHAVVPHDTTGRWREALQTATPHSGAHDGHLLSRTGIEFEAETAEDSVSRRALAAPKFASVSPTCPLPYVSTMERTPSHCSCLVYHMTIHQALTCAIGPPSYGH